MQIVPHQRLLLRSDRSVSQRSVKTCAHKEEEKGRNQQQKIKEQEWDLCKATWLKFTAVYADRPKPQTPRSCYAVMHESKTNKYK